MSEVNPIEIQQTVEIPEVIIAEVSSDIPTRVGIDGDDAFEVWLKIPGNEGKTMQDYLDFLQAPAKEISDEVAINENLRVEAEILRNQSEQTRISNEDTRSSNEQNRVDVESLRVLAEETRVNNEGVRIEAENLRNISESVRLENEEDRVENESQRVTAEDLRILTEESRVTAEGLRVSAESSRDLAEQNRETAESTRELNEGVRISNEQSRETAEGLRSTSEGLRELAENSRLEAEQLRVVAEQNRETAEGLRVLAENDRVSETTQIIGEAQAVVDAGEYIVTLAENIGIELEGKVDKIEGKGLSTEDYTTEEKNKLASIPDLSDVESTLNKVTSITAESTDVQYPSAKAVYTELGSKVDKEEGRGLSTEDYTTTEKNKLSGVAENANNYIHPENHLPSIITQDENNRFVTDLEKQGWNAKLDSSDIANNLTTEVAGKVLDATQGKILNDTKEPNLPPTPSNADIKFLNGYKQWEPMAVGAGGYSAPLYFTSIDSDVSGYKKISYQAEPTVVELSGSVTSSDEDKLLRTYLYDMPLNTTVIDGGPWVSSFKVKVSNANGLTQLVLQVFVRHTNGTETNLFSAVSSEINNTDYEVLRNQSPQGLFSVLETDRLGFRVYARTTSGATITITTSIGDGDASYITTPLAIRHNQLRDLNGDTNYQHVTQTEKDGFEVKSNKRSSFQATPTDTAYPTEKLVKDNLDNKVDKVTGKGLSTEDYTTTEKNKLSGIAENANNYIHPLTHSPSIIEQDENNRFVSDTEKNTWSGKQDALGFTPENVANKKTSITDSDIDYPSGKAVKSALDSKVNTSAVGSVNGLAQLDATGKHKIEQYQDVILGQLKYGGTFNNDGIIISDFSSLNGLDIDNLLAIDWKGFFFIFSGTTATHHLLEFEAGDWLISNGSAGWAKIDNTDAVTLVNGKKGNVTLFTDDISEGESATNKWFTESQVRSTVLTGLSTSNSVISGTDTVLQGFNKAQGQITDIVNKINASALTANIIQKWDGAKFVNSAIREVAGKVAVGNDSPIANMDWVGSSVSRGDVYTYRDVVSKYLGGGSTTGAVEIAFPGGIYDPMLQITIKGYDYSAFAAWEVRVSGYWYPNTWSNYKAEVRGTNPFGSQVRLGYNGTFPVVILGDTSTNWAYGAISISEVNVSYNNLTYFGSGWTITQVTDLTGYTLATPTTHTYIHSGNYSSYALPLSGGTLTGNLIFSGLQDLAWGGGWSLGGATIVGSSEGIYIYPKGNINSGDVRINGNTIYHQGNLTPDLTANYLPYWDGSKLVNSVVNEFGSMLRLGTLNAISRYSWGGDNTNVWIGGASNSVVTGTQSYEGNYNNAIGVDALRSNTTGYYNNAIGVGALNSNTTGTHNNAIGVNALFSNTTGNYNNAIGTDALISNTTGFSNNAIGVNALNNNTTGGFNNAIGVNAGRYISNGNSLTVVNQGVFIGFNTRALGDNSVNEIVIGHEAIGHGNNTVTLGNSSIVKTILRGETLIGYTSNPDNYKLAVNGSGFFGGVLTSLGTRVSDGATEGNFSSRAGGVNYAWAGSNGFRIVDPSGTLDRIIITDDGKTRINTELLVDYSSNPANYKFAVNGSGYFNGDVAATSFTENGTLLSSKYLSAGFFLGKNSVNTLASLPITKQSVLCTVSSATTLSLDGTLDEGLIMHIKVYNSTGSAITQPLPTSSPFESKKPDGTNVSSVTIPANGSIEISIWSLDSKYIIQTNV